MPTRFRVATTGISNGVCFSGLTHISPLNFSFSLRCARLKRRVEMNSSHNLVRFIKADLLF